MGLFKMQQKSILIIGGGEIGLNQIRIAKKIGFNVIVTDKNKNAPGLKEANVAVNIDGKEIEQLIGFSIENASWISLVSPSIAKLTF